MKKDGRGRRRKRRKQSGLKNGEVSCTDRPSRSKKHPVKYGYDRILQRHLPAANVA